MTADPDDGLDGALPSQATRRSQALAAAVAVGGGFAAVALSWTWAGALVGFALFLLWNARREAIERAVDAEATLRSYVGASRELQARDEAAHQPALRRAMQRHGRDWIAGVLRPAPSGSAARGIALLVDGVRVAELSPQSAARYREKHGDAPTAVAFALVERDGMLAIAYV